MYRVYQNQAAAAYLSLHSFIFLSNFQTLNFFVTLFSRTVRPRRLKLGTHVDSGQMYCVYRNRAAAPYLSIYFFSFLSLQFSNIKNFCRTFLRNCEAYKVDTWFTRGQWVDISCTPQSFLFVPYFFVSTVQKLKIFVTLFSGTVRPKSLNLVHLLTVGGCIVYTRIRLLPLICPFISSFFFLSSYQTFTIFVTFFSGTVRPRKLKLGKHVDSGCMCRVYRNYAAAAYFSLYLFSFLFHKFSVTNLSFSSDSTIAGL